MWIHLASVKGRKLVWLGHVTRYDSLSKTILEGILEDRRCRGQQKKCWVDNVKERTFLPGLELPTGPSAEKTGNMFLLNCPSCPPDDLIGQGTELNCSRRHIV